VQSESLELRRVDHVDEGDVGGGGDTRNELPVGSDWVRGRVVFRPCDISRFGDGEEVDLSGGK